MVRRGFSMDTAQNQIRGNAEVESGSQGQQGDRG